MDSLNVVTNDAQISSFSILKNRITIGRSKDSDLVLSDNTVSRHHAEIIRVKEAYFLTDLGSYNGSKVNGRPVQSTPLKHGDDIQIGLTKLTLVLGERASEDATSSIILKTEDDYEKDGQQIVTASPLESSEGLRDLLVEFGDEKKSGRKKIDVVPKKASLESLSQISTLARTNKVLFILYEISQQLNRIDDFDELLRKIMDLIFMVIDADYGFLVLTSGLKGDEIAPVVLKYREGLGKAQPQIKASRTLINKVIQDKVALLTSNAMADSRLDGAKSVIVRKIRSAICVPLWRKDKVIGVIQLDSVRLDNQFTQDDLELLKAIASQMAMVIEQASLNKQVREEERMRNRLERFHSPQVIDMILKSGQEKKDDILEPKEVTATILFADIVGFTRLSEMMPPREINILLNRYFSQMTDIIFSHDGTLDKYIGDGLMAVFGVPMEKEDHAERAIRSAIEIRRQLTTMMKKTGKRRKFDVRIGINTGRVVAGNIGSPKRLEYTVIGDPVNVASRLESIARPSQILIGEKTFERVKDTFVIKKVGPKKVKGKSSDILVYEVLD